MLAIGAGEKLEWAVSSESIPVISPSVISLQLGTGDDLGKNVKIISSKNEKVNTTIKAINYKKNIINDVYNQLTLNCKGSYGVVFRAYNDGIAYRFLLKDMAS